MAVNTRSRRSAALGFGMVWASGTRTPDGTIDAFDRSALLGCYSPVQIVAGIPQQGWTFDLNYTVWAFDASETVFTFGD